jgi:NAD(P)-dependent dehydrogenase (short-subunit alcohol dehydrogenase family)
MNIQGRTAIVTGGASGLGAATARELARRGARVAIFDVDADGGRAVAREIGGAFALVDVRDERSIEAGLAAVGALGLEPARMVINVAGIGGGGRRIAGRKGPHSLELFRTLLEVHAVGTFNVARLAAAALRSTERDAEGERGVIINTSSVVAQDGPTGMVAYAAAKGAIEAMTLPMARDLGPVGIRVCTLVPGNFVTPLTAGLPTELTERLIGMTPFPKRFGDPAEFARLVVHVIENRMLNGTTIRLDGGIRMAIGPTESER